MKSTIVLIFTLIFCLSKSEGRFGLKHSSFFDDDFFYKPWSTFDMMSRDFEDTFRDDPFFDDDDFGFDDDIFPKLSPKKNTDDAGQGVCEKDCEKKKKDLTVPKLSSRVIVNNENEFKFAMNVKGFDRSDVSVKVLDGFLKISGKKSCKEKSDKCGERSFFRYQYLLPKHTDLSKVKARFSKDGFLIVEVPKLQKLEDKSNELQIEEMEEEYLPKLKDDVSSKSKTLDAEDKDEKMKFSKEDKKSEADDAATVEVLP